MPGFAHSGIDDPSLTDTLRGPSADEARESLVYWRARLVTLPVHRRAKRREARAMIVRWEQRLRNAELERWGDGFVGRLAGAIAVWRGERGLSLSRRAAGLVPRWIVVTGVCVVLAASVTAGLVAAAVLSLFT